MTAATADSERSPQNPAQGEAFVRSLVNALMQSSEWNHTAVLLTYDDSGGWYDHVAPPGMAGTAWVSGCRPCSISPYAKAGYVDSTNSRRPRFPGSSTTCSKSRRSRLPSMSGQRHEPVDHPNGPTLRSSAPPRAPSPRSPDPRSATVYLLYLGALLAAALLLIIAFIRQRRPDHPVLASATNGEAVPLPGLGSAGTTRRGTSGGGEGGRLRPPPAARPRPPPGSPSGKILSGRRTSATTATDLLG